MPITRRQFELGINSDVEAWMRRIYAFLAERPKEAFSVVEIAKAHDVRIGASRWSPQAGESIEQYNARVEKVGLFEAALQKLVETGAGMEKEIRGEVYYAKGARSLDSILEKPTPAS